MSATTALKIADRDYIEVSHPDWCTDKSTEHREDNVAVEFVNETVGAVSLVHTCPGPTFGRLRVSGRHYLPNGTWDFDVEEAHPMARLRPMRLFVGRSSVTSVGRDDDLADLIANLTAASDWINKAIADL